ncbi:MCE family protein [Mycobacterium shimoidei]|nr:MCE family protein [Mycobacterium shimoidei]
MHRSETASAATPVAASPGRHFGVQSYVRPLAGLATIAIVAAIVAVSVGLFQGGFAQSAPVTVISPRAGLVMNPDAKVKMRGVQVGKVDSIEARPGGQAVLHLAMYPSALHLIPSNVLVNIASSTVFGAKFVELVPPADPSPQPLRAGQVLDAQHVMVEINTVFEQLTKVLAKIDPAKLNETLGALAKAVSGRGAKIGQALSDLESFLAKLDPALPALSHDLEVSSKVFNAYADAAPDLVKTVANSSEISQSIVDEQDNLDALLVSAIGLADIGNDVLGTNRTPLTTVMHLLVPTTDLTNEYSPALTCGFQALAKQNKFPPFGSLNEPGIWLSASLVFAQERYRYPTHLPKVAATGGPQCLDLPDIPTNKWVPFVVGDVGANPWQYGNPQLLLNFDGLKQLLYGPIAGPPRNSAQVGMPG